MTCSTAAADMFVSGSWFDAIVCWLTAGGDPTLQVVMPTFLYGAVLLSMFVVGQSIIMPVVISLILGGVIFVAFPANALTLLIMAVLLTLSIAGTVVTWRIGR